MRKRVQLSCINLGVAIGLVFFATTAGAQTKAADYIAVGDSALAEFHGMDALKAYQSALELDSNNVPLLLKTITLIKDLFESKDLVYQVGKDYGSIAKSYINRLNNVDSSSKETRIARAQYIDIDHMSVHSHDPKKVTDRYRTIKACVDAVLESADCAGMLAKWYLEEVNTIQELRIITVNKHLKDSVITSADSVIFMQISWDSAMKYLELSHKLAPDNMGYAFLLGQVSFSRGDTAKAKEMLLKVDSMPVRHFRDPQYKRNLANYKARLRIKN